MLENQVRKSKCLFLALGALMLAGCAVLNSEPTPTATPTVSPSPTFTPSPTPLPLVVLMAPSQSGSDANRLAGEEVAAFAGEKGWRFEHVDAGDDILQEMIRKNPAMIISIASGQAEAMSTAAGANPGIQFVAVEEPGAAAADNLLVIGGDSVRWEQTAFMAGLLAGMENRNNRVGWVGEADTMRGLLHRNGFLHGVRYACPICLVYRYELSAAAGTPDAWAASEFLLSVYVDTASAVHSPAGNAALMTLAERHVRISGVHPAQLYGFSDSAASQEYSLGGVVFRPEVLLAEALQGIVAGGESTNPMAFSIENGGLAFGALPNSLLSPGRKAYLDSILDDIRTGRLAVGVNPDTGEEE